MAVIETWVRCDLKKPVQVQMLGGNLFSMDNQGNKIGVEVFDNGAAASLSGTVSGNVIRADGATVAVSGTLSGNKAYIVLPQAAYAVPGFITIVIKLTASSVITTLAAVTGIVYRSSTDTAVDPGTIIPSIQDLIDAINAAIASIPADYSDLLATIAPDFSSSAKYIAGQYVWYNGDLYKFTTTHNASAWSASDAVKAVVCDEIYYSRKLKPGTEIADYTVTTFDGFVRYEFKDKMPEGTYTLTINITSTETDRTKNSYLRFTEGNLYNSGNVVSTYFKRDTDKTYIFTATKPFSAVFIFASESSTASAGLSLTVNTFGLYYGEIVPKNNGFDSSEAINYMLTNYKQCALDAGVYSAKSPIDMPANGSLTGSGSNTKISIPDNNNIVNGFAGTSGEAYIYNNARKTNPGHYWGYINVSSTDTSGSVCRVVFCSSSTYSSSTLVYSFTAERDKDVFFEFDSNDYVWHKGIYAYTNSTNSAGKTVTVNRFDLYCDGGILPYIHNETASECWVASDQSYAITLEPGYYTVKTNVTSTATGNSSIKFMRSTGRPYSSNDLIYTHDISNGSSDTFDFYLSERAFNIWIFAGVNSSASSGKTVTVNNLSITKLDCGIVMHDRCEVKNLLISGGSYPHKGLAVPAFQSAILWGSSSEMFGDVDCCWLENFSNSGILMQSTGTDVDHNLAISDCFIYGNCVGLFIRKNSEFHKIANCTVTENHFGTLNRGGNNSISNCGFDKNIIGIQVDSDEGTNNGHGEITGCTINHSNENNGYGLIIKDTGRELVNNCNFYYSDILLQNTNGNIISNCGFGQNAEITIDGGGCSLIIGCMMRSTENTITITNNTTAQVINCYTRNGGAVTPV